MFFLQGPERPGFSVSTMGWFRAHSEGRLGALGAANTLPGVPSRPPWSPGLPSSPQPLFLSVPHSPTRSLAPSPTLAPSPSPGALPPSGPPSQTPAPYTPGRFPHPAGSPGHPSPAGSSSLERSRACLSSSLIVSRFVWEVRPRALLHAKFINRAVFPDVRWLQPGEQVDWDQSSNRWSADNEFLDTYLLPQLSSPRPSAPSATVPTDPQTFK